MFYKLSAPHVSLREYMYEGNLITKPIVFVIACVVKLLRIPIQGSTDIPPVDSLGPFRIESDQMTPAILHAITGMDQQLHDLGFDRVSLLGLNDLQSNTRYGGAVYRSPDGETVAWTRFRLWPNLERHNKFTRLALYSLGPAGEIILTTAATRDLLDPPDWNVEYRPKTPANLLRDLHQAHVRRVLGSARPMIAHDSQAAFDLLEHTHSEFVAFQIQRQIFVDSTVVPVSASAQKPASGNPDTWPDAGLENVSATAAGLIERPPASVAPLADEVVDAEGVATNHDVVPESDIEFLDDPESNGVLGNDEMQPIVDAVRLQETKQSGWLTKLIILGVSIALFVTLGALQWELELVLILVPILLVHELGHYIAMQVFGYKNIHMFFIPLLGAAVSGRNYRVSGWKKCIVALAGPLPSIGLGLVIGAFGFWYELDWCFKAAIITLILNVMNLAPFLPLDGGQVAHVTVFSRSNVLDLLFRIGTIVVLLIVAALLDAKFLFGLGIAMTVGLPTVWKTMKVTDVVRGQRLPEPTNDEMPVESIRAVVAAIHDSNLPSQGTQTLAKLTLSVYENVIARPPEWPATIAIWVLYIGGLFGGVFGMIALTFASIGGDVFDFVPEYETKYEQIDASDGDFSLSETEPDSDRKSTDLLAWRFPDPETAQNAFETLRDRNDHSVSRLGTMVFTGLPRHDIKFEVAMEQLDFQEQAEAMERHSNDDPRLDVLSDESWRRSFNTSPPELIVVVDSNQAEAIIGVCESVPAFIAGYAPISPWTPKSELTPEQSDLQHRLLVLQGRSSETPWESEPLEIEVGNEADMTPEQFRDSIKRSAEQRELALQNRLNWIIEQAKTTTGATQRLYDAYSEFEDVAKAWREDQREPENKTAYPDINTYLEPLLPELGYLHRDHKLLATSASVEAYELDQFDIEELVNDSFPIPVGGQTLVSLYVYPTHDTAAALACVHAWLNQNNVESVVWSYNTFELPE